MSLKPKRARSSYVLLAGVMALVIVGSLVAFQVVSGLTKSQISQRQKVNIIPLDGSIETEAVNNLSSRRKIGEAEFTRLVFNSASDSGQTQQ